MAALIFLLLSFGLIKSIDNHTKVNDLTVKELDDTDDTTSSVIQTEKKDRIFKRSLDTVLQENSYVPPLCNLLFGWISKFGADPCAFKEKTPPRFSYCPEGGIVPADFGKTTAKYSWRRPTVFDNQYEVSNDSEYKSGSVFESGKHTVTYTFTDSDGDRAFCRLTFEIKVITCSLLPMQDHAKASYSKDGFIYGSNATVTCFPGYEMYQDVNTQSITCEANENNFTSYWSTSPNHCKAISCPLNDSAIQPTHGQIQCTDENKFYSFCYTECEDGYVLESDAAVCLENKTWSNTVSDCEDIEPPIVTYCPSDIVMVTLKNQSEPIYWKEPMADDNSGRVMISQISGLFNGSTFPTGRSQLKYNISDGTYFTVCEFNVFVEELFCIPLPKSKLITMKCTDGYRFGSVCHFACPDNFILVGNTNTTCQKNENMSQPAVKWDIGNQRPYCEVNKENPCPELPSPPNGNMSCVSGEYGVVCKLHCFPSYDIPLGIDGSEFDGVFHCALTGGFYYPSNIVSSCTARGQPLGIKGSGSFFFNIDDCNNVTLIAKIENNFRYYVRNLQQSGFDGVCSDQFECNVSDITVTCRQDAGNHYRRKRTTTHTHLLTVNFDVFSGYPNIDISNQEKKSLINSKLRTIIDFICVNYDVEIFFINGFQPNTSSCIPRIEDPTCNLSRKWQPSSDSCVPCNAGKYLLRTNSTHKDCIECPRGTFKSEEDELNCTLCPEGTFTANPGSKSLEDCIEACKPGMYSTDGVIPCSKCPKSTFQPGNASTDCIKCPPGKITHIGGNVGSTDCQDFDVLFQKKGDTVELHFDKIGIENTSAISVFLWIRISEKLNNFTILSIIDTSFKLMIIYTDRIQISRTGSEWQTSAILELEKWEHLGVVFDAFSKTVDVYKNGQRVTSDSESPNPFYDLPLVSPDSHLTITQNYNNEVDISGYVIHSGVLDNTTIQQLSRKCDISFLENNQQLISNIPDGWFNGVQKTIPSLCVSINHCFPNHCNGHRCFEYKNTFSCRCQGGYSGKKCENQPDFCKMHPCLNEATCKNFPTNFTCVCSEGYKGIRCEQKTRNGEWGDWGRFSECSASCGGGSKVRSRKCYNPLPDPEGIICNESLGKEFEQCNEGICKSCEEFPQTYGTVSNCSNSSDGQIKCRVLCQPGFIVPHPSRYLPEYNCGPNTSFIWTGKPLACLRGKGPIKASVTIRIKNDTSCIKGEFFSETIMQKYKQTDCELQRKCSFEVNLPV